MWYFWSLHQAAAQDRAHEGSSQTELDCLSLTRQINEEQSGGEGVPARICPKRSSLLLSCREKVTAAPFSSWWFLCFKQKHQVAAGHLWEALTGGRSTATGLTKGQGLPFPILVPWCSLRRKSLPSLGLLENPRATSCFP